MRRTITLCPHWKSSVANHIRDIVPQLLTLLISVALYGCGERSSSTSVEQPQPATPEQDRPAMNDPTTPALSIRSTSPPEEFSPVQFELVNDSGIDFVYFGNPGPRHHMTEQNGGGVALFDFDQDGWSDVFLVNGSDFDRPAEKYGAVHLLARNATRADGPIRFKSVSEASRLALSDFGMGVAAGDFDNDGFPDLFLCSFGRIRLWRNEGDGTFTEITAAAGMQDASWSAGAAFADLDDDGDLDLYVTNYVVYSPTDDPCFTQHQPPVRISCGPIGRIAQPDTLWENLGDGTFANASETSGIRSVEAGKGLAVEIADINGDHRLDVYVANDTSPNLLFVNQSSQPGSLAFAEDGTLQGVAVSADGGNSSSMGIACADFNSNGWFDLFVTNFENSINDYYDHVSESAFLHRSGLMGLDTPSRPMLAFGTVAADFDLDQWPDLFVANGHIWDLTSLGFGHQYAMPPQLFWNDHGRRFRDASRGSGDYFADQWLGRAAATGDLDQDGRTDLVVTHLIRPTAIVRNVSERQGTSVRLRLIGRIAARTPLGITVKYRCGENAWTTHTPSGGSFAASHDPQVLLSTGSAATIDELTIHWSSQHTEVWQNLPASGAITLLEGTGQSQSDE